MMFVATLGKIPLFLLFLLSLSLSSSSPVLGEATPPSRPSPAGRSWISLIFYLIFLILNIDDKPLRWTVIKQKCSIDIINSSEANLDQLQDQKLKIFNFLSNVTAKCQKKDNRKMCNLKYWKLWLEEFLKGLIVFCIYQLFGKILPLTAAPACVWLDKEGTFKSAL